MTPNTATILGRLAGSDNLSMEEMAAAIDAIMRGQWSEEQIALLLTGLAAKGETVDEVAGAAAGVPVAKHGNRSITSRSGSADVLAELGVNINASVPQVEACLNELGLCFCFAPLMHPSMKHVAAVRKKLGIRTIFNVLGPLATPAGACYQLLGAGRPELRPLLAGAMARLGTRRTLVVCGEDGLGDVTLAGTTSVTEVSDGSLREFTWRPEDFGIAPQPLAGLAVDSPAASAAIIRSILA